MSGAFFGKMCGCGRTSFVPAPLFTDILPAQEAMAAEGWGYDAHGRVRCPSCLSDATTAPEVSPAPPAPQGELF